MSENELEDEEFDEEDGEPQDDEVTSDAEEFVDEEEELRKQKQKKEEEARAAEEDEEDEEFESEFEEELEEEEEDDDAQKILDSYRDQISPAKQEIPKKTLKETVLEIKEKLMPLLGKARHYIDFGLNFLKTFKLKIGNKKYSIFALLKITVKVIIVIIILNTSFGYFQYLTEIYDASFMQKSLINDPTFSDREEDLDSDDLALLDDEELHDIGSIFKIRNILLNIRYKDTNEDGLLKVSVGMEVSDDELLDELNQRKNQLKHLIILNLSHVFYEEVRDVRKRKKLKNIIKNKINGFLTTGSIRRVFFTEFVFN